MHETLTSFFVYLPSFSYSSLPVPVNSTTSTVSKVSTASSLVSVTVVEVAKTDTSFLVFGDIWWRNVSFVDNYNTRLERHLSLLL